MQSIINDKGAGRAPAGKVFMDSGAFSVYNGTMPYIDIPAYCNFLVELDGRDGLAYAVIPDVINDYEATKSNTIRFIDELNGRIDLKKIVGVIHCTQGIKKLIQDYQAVLDDLGITYLAIGGLAANENRSIRNLVINEAFKVLVRDKFRIHLLGIEVPKIIFNYKPDSVDSSSYLQFAVHFKLSYLDNDMEFNTILLSRTYPDQFLAIITKYKKMMKQLMLAKYPNINEDKLTRQLNRLADAPFIASLNLYYRRLLESMMQEQDKDFKFWTTLINFSNATELSPLWYGKILLTYYEYYLLSSKDGVDKLQKEGYGIVK